MIKPKYNKYGWHPDIPDRRDYQYKTIRPKLKLPGEVDLRSQCSLVEDQGRLGSCTAQALAGNLEFLDNKVDNVYIDVSRLFIYYNERLIEGVTESDSGASLRVGIKSLKKYGACEEIFWPYVIEKFAIKPSKPCYEKAKDRIIQSYYRLNNLSEMLICLADGFPFVFGFTVYESFESEIVASTGKVPMPSKTERVIGGHAVMAVGFIKNKQQFIVRNSWGTNWGLSGYFFMPFQYLETLATDFWTIRK